jgi:Esterase-like activity of phytase
MLRRSTLTLSVWSVLALSARANAETDLIAIGELGGDHQDLARHTSAPLENGIAGNLLGGIGSGLAYAGDSIFLGLPDRGPNANAYNGAVDDTVSYIARFQTLSLKLRRAKVGSTLPFALTPALCDSTLLSSRTPLAYGSGLGLGYQVDGVTPLGSGAPALNKTHTYYFTGRSDNFDPSQLSTAPINARLDPEGIRVSRDGKSVFISDEYGPFVYQFERESGRRIKAFALPDNLAITTLSSQKDVEIAANTVGRVTNKGMEGLAITPDGSSLVGMMQANLEQDKKKSLRIVTIDIASGATHEYAYQLTDGSGVSEIVAVNNHQFLVDERDGTGMADTPLMTDVASAAIIKKLFLIDLDGAQDVSGVSGDLSGYAVTKSLFMDVVGKLTAAGINSYFIPSKLEGVAFGQDVVINGVTKHTLYLANDNDFLATIADPLKQPGDVTRGTVANPNKIYVFAFDDVDLPGFVPQQIKGSHDDQCRADNDRDHDHDHEHSGGR